MTRKEEIINAAYNEAEVERQLKMHPQVFEQGFVAGAEWADAHPDIDVRTMAAWQSGYKEAIEVTEPESPFKVGDKVVINCREEFATAYNGKEGKIINIFDLEKNRWGNIIVKLDNGMRNAFYASELIKNNNPYKD